MSWTRCAGILGTALLFSIDLTGTGTGAAAGCRCALPLTLAFHHFIAQACYHVLVLSRGETQLNGASFSSDIGLAALFGTGGGEGHAQNTRPPVASEFMFNAGSRSSSPAGTSLSAGEPSVGEWTGVQRKAAFIF